jgi:hypothetical protein
VLQKKKKKNCCLRDWTQVVGDLLSKFKALSSIPSTIKKKVKFCWEGCIQKLQILFNTILYRFIRIFTCNMCVYICLSTFIYRLWTWISLAPLGFSSLSAVGVEAAVLVLYNSSRTCCPSAHTSGPGWTFCRGPDAGESQDTGLLTPHRWPLSELTEREEQVSVPLTLASHTGDRTKH